MNRREPLFSVEDIQWLAKQVNGRDAEFAVVLAEQLAARLDRPADGPAEDVRELRRVAMEAEQEADRWRRKVSELEREVARLKRRVAK